MIDTNNSHTGRKIWSHKLGFFALGGLALLTHSPVAAQHSDAQAEQASAAAVSPARLSAAMVTVDYLFPLGTYERMMKGTLDQLMDSILSQTFDRPMAETMKGYGIEDGKFDELGDTSFNDILKKQDPHFEERMKISTRVMMDEMVDLMTEMEPALREALSRIYARKFTVSQLAEMNRFFATDTGTAFARDYMMVFVDPEMMQSMMGIVPEIMQAMPTIMTKVEEATAHLPPPSRNEAESMDEQLSEMADESPADMDEDAASSRSENWSEDDRQTVAKLEAEYEAAFAKYFEAQEAAQENAKKRLKKD